MTSNDIGWRLDRLALSRFHWRVLTLIAGFLLLQIVVLLFFGIETKQRSLEGACDSAGRRQHCERSDRDQANDIVRPTIARRSVNQQT